MVGNASLHLRGNAQCLVNPAKIVMHEMKGNRVFVTPVTIWTMENAFSLMSFLLERFCIEESCTI